MKHDYVEANETQDTQLASGVATEGGGLGV